MTCECVTVDYPSAKLLPLVNTAIQLQKHELFLLDDENTRRVSAYKNSPWYKRWFGNNPEYWGNPDWVRYCVESNCVSNNLKELRKVRLAAENSDTVRLTGNCLSKITEWAGN